MSERFPSDPSGHDADAELRDRTRRALGRLRDIAPTGTADLTGATQLGDRRRSPLLAVAAALVVLLGVAGMIHLSGRSQAPGVAEQPSAGVATSQPAMTTPTTTAPVTTTSTVAPMTTVPVVAPATSAPAVATSELADPSIALDTAPPTAADTAPPPTAADTAPPPTAADTAPPSTAAAAPPPTVAAPSTTAGSGVVVAPLPGSRTCGEPTFEIVPAGGAALEEVVAADGVYVWRWPVTDGVVEAHWPEWQPLYSDALSDAPVADVPVADAPVVDGTAVDGVVFGSAAVGAGDPASGLAVTVDDAVFGRAGLSSSVTIAADGIVAAFEIEATLDPPRCPVSFVLFDAGGSMLGNAAILPGERAADAGGSGSFEIVVTAPLISAITTASAAELGVVFARRGMCDLYGALADDAATGHATPAEALHAVVASVGALPTDGYVEVSAGESMVGYLLGAEVGEPADVAAADAAVLVERRSNGTWSVTEAASVDCLG